MIFVNIFLIYYVTLKASDRRTAKIPVLPKRGNPAIPSPNKYYRIYLALRLFFKVSVDEIFEAAV
jgi:hypothetical protein